MDNYIKVIRQSAGDAGKQWAVEFTFLPFLQPAFCCATPALVLGKQIHSMLCFSAASSQKNLNAPSEINIGL
jgi:hypothetical protein